MKKEEKLEVTREKLLNAAQKLMENTDDEAGVTSRAISEESGVPVGMINYCFGSKEGLLFAAFNKNADEYKDIILKSEEVSESSTPKEKLKKIYYFICELLISKYKFTGAITKYVLLNHIDFNTLPFVTEHYKGRKTEQECKIICYELTSIMQLSVYRYKDIKKFSGYDFTDKEQLHKFIDIQFDLFLID